MVFGPSESSDAMSDQSPHYGQPGGSQFPITTALVFPDHEIEHSLGMVFGVVVRSMGIARTSGRASSRSPVARSSSTPDWSRTVGDTPWIA